MKKFVLILLITCIFFPMCKQGPYNGDAIFVDFDNPERVSLFDYFSSIELIPLETSSEVLVAAVTKIVVHQDRYYALDPRQSIIFVFDKSGKFIFKIDKKGRGPGEYSSLEDFNINPFSGNLELLEPFGLVHLYALSGDYIETKRISYPDFRAVHMFVPISSHTHVFYAMFQPQKIIYFNLDENKLLHEEFEEHERLGRFGLKNFYQYQEEWFFFRPFHPVVYKVGTEQLEAAFQFDFGQYTREGTKAVFSEEANNNRDKYREEVFAQFPYVITSVRHNNNYVLASLLWRNVDSKASIIYDKSARKSKFVPEFSEQVMFHPDNGREIIMTDEHVLTCCPWSELENYITREMLDDKNKMIFDGLMQAPMEHNPVLIKYHFK